MKKFFWVCFAVALVCAFFKDRHDNNAVEYVTAEGTPERVAEGIIRDVWGARSHRAGEEPIKRVEVIRSIPQVDGTLALDMRIHIEGATEHGVLTGLLDHAKKFFPKLVANEKLNGYNEFRLYGSLPMTDGRGHVSEDYISKVFFTRKAIQEVAWDKTKTPDLHFVLSKMNDGKNCTYWVHDGILSKIGWLKTYSPNM